jgi:hypothetical protein
MDAVPSPWQRAYWTGPLDQRALGLFRAVFGALVLWDFMGLWPHLEEFFTDQGLLPRDYDANGWLPDSGLNVLRYVGELPGVQALWAVGFAAGVLLMLGVAPRLAAAVEYVVLVSFQMRFLPMLDRSDTVIRMMTLFLIFAPSGQCYSLPAWLAARRGAPRGLLGPGWPTRVLQLQITWVYVCTGIHKLRGEPWRDGTALYYAWHVPHLVTRPWAVPLSQLGWLVWLLTVGTLVLELGWPLFAFPPRWPKHVKALLLLSGVGLHVGIWLTINVGNFSLMMIVSYLVYLEPEWLDWVERKLGWAAGTASLEDVDWSGVGLRATSAVLLFVATWYSLPMPDVKTMPDGLKKLVEDAGLANVWNMFSPIPVPEDWTLSAPVRFADGTTQDLYGGAAWQRPWLYDRVNKYEDRMANHEPELARAWALRTCRVRKSASGAKAQHVLLTRDLMKTPPPGQPPPAPVHEVLTELDCP